MIDKVLGILRRHRVRLANRVAVDQTAGLAAQSSPAAPPTARDGDAADVTVHPRRAAVTSLSLSFLHRDPLSIRFLRPFCSMVIPRVPSAPEASAALHGGPPSPSFALRGDIAASEPGYTHSASDESAAALLAADLAVGATKKVQ